MLAIVGSVPARYEGYEYTIFAISDATQINRLRECAKLNKLSWSYERLSICEIQIGKLIDFESLKEIELIDSQGL